MESKKRRNSYTCVQKLEIVQYAKIHCNREVDKVYNVNEASIREWKENKRILETLKPNTRARRGRKAHSPVLESQLKAWVLNLRHSRRRVSTTSIKLNAFSIAKQEKLKISKEATSSAIGLCIEISLVSKLLLWLVKACL